VLENAKLLAISENADRWHAKMHSI